MNTDEDVTRLMRETRLDRSVPVAILKDGSFIFGQARVLQHEGLVCELLEPAALPGGHRYLELTWPELAELYRLMDAPELDVDEGKDKERLKLHLRSPKPRPYLMAVEKTCGMCGGLVDFKGLARRPPSDEAAMAEVHIEVREDPSVPPGHQVWLVAPGE